MQRMQDRGLLKTVMLWNFTIQIYLDEWNNETNDKENFLAPKMGRDTQLEENIKIRHRKM